MNGYMILKLLLQPLVENALYHGIKYKRGGGVIRVHGMLQDGMLALTATMGTTDVYMYFVKAAAEEPAA